MSWLSPTRALMEGGLDSASGFSPDAWARLEEARLSAVSPCESATPNSSVGAPSEAAALSLLTPPDSAGTDARAEARRRRMAVHAVERAQDAIREEPASMGSPANMFVQRVKRLGRVLGGSLGPRSLTGLSADLSSPLLGAGAAHGGNDVVSVESVEVVVDLEQGAGELVRLASDDEVLGAETSAELQSLLQSDEWRTARIEALNAELGALEEHLLPFGADGDPAQPELRQRAALLRQTVLTLQALISPGAVRGTSDERVPQCTLFRVYTFVSVATTCLLVWWLMPFLTGLPWGSNFHGARHHAEDLRDADTP